MWNIYRNNSYQRGANHSITLATQNGYGGVSVHLVP